jgi:hypothetical protein
MQLCLFVCVYDKKYYNFLFTINFLETQTELATFPKFKLYPLKKKIELKENMWENKP